jgi:hypothetical protein
MELILDDDYEPTYHLPTTRRGAHLEGRLALTAEVVAAIRDATYVMIYAPSDMEEAWHGGNAPALRRLAHEC